jgi:hypothetical protein
MAGGKTKMAEEKQVSLCATCIYGISMVGNTIQRTARIKESPGLFDMLQGSLSKRREQAEENPYLKELGDLHPDYEDEDEEPEIEVEVAPLPEMTEVKYEERLTRMAMNHCFWPNNPYEDELHGGQSLALADCFISQCSRYKKDNDITSMEV